MTWTEQTNPNDECHYTHTKTDTPLGVARIEWKDWKVDPSFSLFVNEEYITETYSLEDAKDALTKHLKDLLKVLNDFLL